MRAFCNRDDLLAAFNMVSGVVPARSPKPILQDVKLVVDEDGSVLMATDLEVGIRHRVLGVRAEQPGAVILPTTQIGSILRTSGDEELELNADSDRLIVRGRHAEFTLPLQDAGLFPEVPDFAATSYHIVPAGSLKKLIRRTSFATDLMENARYALGGVLVELAPDSIAMVGTDGRRLARMQAPAESENAPAPPGGTPVIPVKALKLIERNLVDDGMQVHLAIQAGTAALVRTDDAVIYTRLVEGRFPRYQDVFPTNVEVRIPLEAGPLRLAVEQASIVTSNDSRGVDFQFGPGVLKLASQATDVGSSHVELPINYDGKPVEITFDPRYLVDALKTLDDATRLTAELIDSKNAAVFKTEDKYTYVVMPLTRDR